MASFDYDFNEVPESEFSVLPEGDYVVVATASDKKLNKEGTSHYLEVIYEVIDGDYKGRKIWERYNLWHAKPTVANISRRDIKKLAQCCGFTVQPSDSNELHNIPLIVRLSVFLDTYMGKQEEKNKIGDYLPASAGIQKAPNAMAPTPMSPNAAAAAPAAGVRVVPAWQRK